MTPANRRSPSGPVVASSTVLFASHPSNPLGIATGYVPLLPIPVGLPVSGLELANSIVLPHSGSLSLLIVNVFGVPSSTTATYTVRVNGVNTALSVTLAAGEIFASNPLIVPVAANQRFAIQTVLGAAVAGPTDVRVSVDYE